MLPALRSSHRLVVCLCSALPCSALLYFISLAGSPHISDRPFTPTPVTKRRCPEMAAVTGNPANGPVNFRPGAQTVV
jgi:hypothetical protein